MRMLSPYLEMVDLDGRQLANWLALFLPPGLGDARWIVAFVDGDRRVVHALESGKGRIEPASIALAGVSPRELASARRRLGVGLLAVVEVDALAKLHAEIEGRLRLDDDYVAQSLVALRALKRASGAGIWLDPPLLDLIPPLAAEPLARTFELLVPASSALVAYVFDSRPGEVYASIIAVVEDGEISLVTTHLALEDALPGPALARSWRTQTDRVLALVAERYAAPAIGLFVERAAWQRLLTGPSDQLDREMSAGHLIFDPAPAWLRGILGGAQLAAFATRSARSFARLVPSAARRGASRLAEAAQERLKSAGAHPFALLGFDPIELWHRVRTYYQPLSGSTRSPTAR